MSGQVYVGRSGGHFRFNSSGKKIYLSKAQVAKEQAVLAERYEKDPDSFPPPPTIPSRYSTKDKEQVKAIVMKVMKENGVAMKSLQASDRLTTADIAIGLLEELTLNRYNHDSVVIPVMSLILTLFQ